MNEEIVASRVEVTGIVQGVGFRPFVYKLALGRGLRGKVVNTADGVTIDLEGTSRQLKDFQHDLTESPPPLARITGVRAHRQTLRNYQAFTIARSEGAGHRAALISPDMSICQDCRRELFDSGDRRFGYPFINCTNCGPRYTIIEDIPYDRPKTAMRHFTMCPRCQAEYDDPLDRRFHAQPNACAVCGPHVSLFDNRRNPLKSGDPIKTAAELLSKGLIVAIKGLGGFHLAVDAENESAVVVLRKRKHREEKPLALMAASVEKVRRFARVAPEDEALLKSRRRPIVLLPRKYPNPIAPSTAPGNRYFGVMLPYTPLHCLLLENNFSALVMTSGNLSEEPIAIDNEDAFERLGNIADYFLIHDRDIYLRTDDSIVKRTAGQTRPIRRSRGWVPVPVFLKDALPPILACGAELKNTVCLTKGNRAFLSQHIGDLENLTTLKFFELTVDHLERILDITPGIAAYDLHPDYLSTRYALELTEVEKIGVQHHHAHIVSCLAENKQDGPVIGLSFDGTGYGTDGHIWGGEILVATAAEFQRAAHLAYIPMPGSAAAIREPWRMAVSYLNDAFAENFQELGLPAIESKDHTQVKTILEMTRKGFNSPLTSSLGRLFDGVAAIIGLRDRVAFEGQAAMELEMIAKGEPDSVYGYDWEGNAPPYRIAVAPLVRGVAGDVRRGVPPGVISARFHATLIAMFTELTRKIAREYGIRRVALSGGVFQNSLLLDGMIRSLSAENFEVITHTRVPANDGGIALGQAVAAAAMIGENQTTKFFKETS